jgi:hypothetical protein
MENDRDKEIEAIKDLLKQGEILPSEAQVLIKKIKGAVKIVNGSSPAPTSAPMPVSAPTSAPVPTSAPAPAPAPVPALTSDDKCVKRVILMPEKEVLNYLKNGMYSYESEKNVVEIFKKLASNDSRKVYLKVLEECFAQKGLPPEKFVEVFKILIERKNDEIDLEILKKFGKLKPERLEKKEFVEVLERLAKSESKKIYLRVEEICRASINFIDIFRILVDKKDNDVDLKIFQKLETIGKKSPQQFEGKFDNLFRLLLNRWYEKTRSGDEKARKTYEKFYNIYKRL